MLWCMGSRGFKGFLTSSHSFSHSYKSMALADLFGHLSHSLIRANARAILSPPTLCSRLMTVLCAYIDSRHDTTNKKKSGGHYPDAPECKGFTGKNHM